jgi:hypothetical protein
MSSLKLDNIQVGRDSDPTKNFHFRTVAANDFRLSSGNIGSPVNDLMKLTNTDVTLLNPKAVATPPQFDNSKLLATTDWVSDKNNFQKIKNAAASGCSLNLFLNPAAFTATGPVGVSIVADGTGGYILAFSNSYDGSSYLNRSVVVGRVTSSGWTQWASIAATGPVGVSIVADGTGGYILAFSNHYDGSYLNKSVVAGRVTSSGWTQWASIAATGPHDVSIVADGTGGYILAFSNYYDGTHLNKSVPIYRLTVT